MTVTPFRTHIRIDSALRAWAATTRWCARATSHTAATSSSVISVRADGTAGVDVSPDGTIFRTSTPSRHASRAARRNSTGPSHGSVYIASPGSRCIWRRSPTPPVTVNCTLAAFRRGPGCSPRSMALPRDDVEPWLRRRGAEARRIALVEVELRVLQRQQQVLFDRDGVERGR